MQSPENRQKREYVFYTMAVFAHRKAPKTSRSITCSMFGYMLPFDCIPKCITPWIYHQDHQLYKSQKLNPIGPPFLPYPGPAPPWAVPVASETPPPAQRPRASSPPPPRPRWRARRPRRGAGPGAEAGAGQGNSGCSGGPNVHVGPGQGWD